MLTSIPDGIFATHILNRLSLSDIQSLTLTCKPLCQTVYSNFMKRADKTFIMGPWHGTWDLDNLYFKNGPLKKIYCKTYLSRNIDHSYEKYYRVRIHLKEPLLSKKSLSFYRHPYFEDLKKWIRYYFLNLQQFQLSIRLKLNHPFKKQNIDITYRKRGDGCNTIGIILCWHNCIFPHPILQQKEYRFTQRLGFDLKQPIMYPYTLNENHRYTLNLKSEVSIYFNSMVEHDPTESYSNTVYFTLTKNSCIAVTDIPKFDENSMLHTDYLWSLELFANAIRSTLEMCNYANILNQMPEKLNQLASKYHIPVNNIHLDVPESIDDAWSLLQKMELHQIYYKK